MATTLAERFAALPPMTPSEAARTLGVSRQRIDQLAHPQRHAARRAVAEAEERGELVRPAACEECQSPSPLQGHHPDYSRPLDVQWLCSECHGKAHRKPLRASEPTAEAAVPDPPPEYRQPREVSRRVTSFRFGRAALDALLEVEEATAVRRSALLEIGLRVLLANNLRDDLAKEIASSAPAGPRTASPLTLSLTSELLDRVAVVARGFGCTRTVLVEAAIRRLRQSSLGEISLLPSELPS